VTDAWFDDIYLEDEQRELLARMVERERSVPPEQSDSFHFWLTSGGSFLQHVQTRLPARRGDVDTLAEYGLLRRVVSGTSSPMYDITPRGRRYYAQMKRRSGEAATVVDAEIRVFLDGSAFMESFPGAYALWREAEQELWGAENLAQMTRLGHTCREALQEFATSLAQRCGVEVPADRAMTVQAIRAVLGTRRLGETHQAFLDALLTYWGTVSDLVQRQEHGAAREKEPLTWEDARRVVFQTVIVMFEIARSVL